MKKKPHAYFCDEVDLLIEDVNGKWYEINKEKIMLTGKAKEDFEKWLDVYGFEGFYQISNRGNVKSLDRRVKCGYGKTRLVKGKPLNSYLNRKTGYLCIDLQSDGIRIKYALHRLVAWHFVEMCEDDLEVNHKDCNKLNNCPSNLEWVTRSQNTQHAYDNGLINKKKRV